MKNIAYILFIFLTACRFDPGSTPQIKTNNDIIDTKPIGKDMARDGTTNDRDVSLDLSKEPDVSVSSDTSTDDMPKDLVAADMTKDVGPSDMGSMCNGLPVDLKINADNCGTCDNACDANFATCEEGNCACPENAEPCGADNKCEDTKNDPLNCGGCGVSCGLAAECVNSACVCRDGYRDCNGKCSNLVADPLNCGQCGNVCPDNKSCNNGDCENTCLGAGWSCEQPNGKTSCAKRSDIYTCNSRASDRCGTECAVGETCVRNGGISATYRCRTNRPTIACQTCPCAECSGDEECVVSAFAGNEIFCVEK